MATYPLTWLADVLRAAGCTVIEHGDWKHHGRDGNFNPNSIMIHHDASPAGETSHGWEVIYYGREGLEGPLSQLWLDFDGVWHIIAAGRANHAGEGGPWGVIPKDAGNTYAIGIETDHTTGEKWQGGQKSEALKGVHALCQKLGINTTAEIDRAFLAHKEWAPDRKIDPDPMNMDDARRQLANYDGEDGDTPVKTIQKGAADSPRTLIKGSWKDLQFDDDEDVAGGPYVIFGGPVGWYSATIQAYVSGPPGTSFQLRPYRTANGHDDEFFYALRDYVLPPDGTMGVEIAHQAAVADDWYLRVQGTSLGGNVTITRTWAEIATW
jgi:hypothetical protein